MSAQGLNGTRTGNAWTPVRFVPVGVTSQPTGDERIHESEELFRQVALNMREVFFVTSASLGEILYVSPAYEEVWGRSCQSLYDNPLSAIDAIPDEDREALFTQISKGQKGALPAPVEYRVVRPDGSTRWVLTHMTPITDATGQVYRMSGSALDVTDRHVAEAALKEKETQFRLLTETSFDGIDIVVNGIIKEANQGLADMLGYTLDEMIGRPALDFVHKESQGIVESRLADGVEGLYEFIGKHKSGKRLIIECASRMHQIDGEMGRLTALRDVTEKRNLEDQFRQAQKMEAVGRLAGGVAHDFNNLLTVIMAYTQMLSEELGPDSRHADDLGEIQKASVAAAALTRQLLAFSRQQVIEPALVSLNDVVDNARKMLARLIGEDVELITTFTGEPIAVLIDPGQVEQALMNLAVNARDAMPVGGRLTVETAIVDLDADYMKDHWPAVAGRFARLALSDTGFGMTAETRERIFEPFFTTKEAGKGTGLGLPTVDGIVKQSNGFISVSSEPGKGTTFNLYIPLADAIAITCAPIAAPTARGSETILLVEDSTPVRIAAKRILELSGYRVLETPSGKAGLALAAKKQEEIHLLVTDVVMPEMSGREVAEKFALLRPKAKVLFMSGYTDDAVVRHGILHEGVAYLQKPFTADTLARKVRATLDAVAY